MNNDKPMKKDLTVVFDDYWSDFSPDDFKPPRVTIGMGSPSRGKLGHFNFSTGESLEKLEQVTFLARTNGFVLYGGRGAVPPRCASDDGVLPAPRISDPISPQCSICFAKEWGHDLAKDRIQSSVNLASKGEQPICQQTISMIMLDRDSIPFILTVKTFNVKIVKQFLFTPLRMKSIGYRTKPFGIAFDLSLKPIEGLGNRYELVVNNWLKLDEAACEMRLNLYDMFAREVKNLEVAVDDELG